MTTINEPTVNKVTVSARLENISILHEIPLPNDISVEVVQSSAVQGVEPGSSFSIVEFMVSYGSGVTTGIVANYIYDLIRSQPTKNISIKVNKKRTEVAVEKIKINIEH